MIAIVVPAHNEAELIGRCLHSLREAARDRRLEGEPVDIVVALDDCTDDTEQIVVSAGVRSIRTDARNVGIARAAGVAEALAVGARWLAFTDADSTVAPDWLHAQVSHGTDAVCGTVDIADWGCHPASTRIRYAARYQKRDGHRHIHGANLGVSATAYRHAGGFPPLKSGEDVALVKALAASGASIAWSSRPRVSTSARPAPRAPAGFGAYLLALSEPERVDQRSSRAR
ncbi:MAG: glycosyltransferase family 2 protein [Lautropia sp.]